MARCLHNTSAMGWLAEAATWSPASPVALFILVGCASTEAAEPEPGSPEAMSDTEEPPDSPGNDSSDDYGPDGCHISCVDECYPDSDCGDDEVCYDSGCMAVSPASECELVSDAQVIPLGGEGTVALSFGQADADAQRELFARSEDELRIHEDVTDAPTVQALSIDEPGAPTELLTGDLDGDGRDEVFSAEGGTSAVMRVFALNSGGAYEQVQRLAMGLTNAYALADVSGDGGLEMVGRSGRGFGVVATAGGRLANVSGHGFEGIRSVVAADYEGSSHANVVVDSPHGLSLYPGGELDASSYSIEAGNPWERRLVVADVLEDDKPDLVSVEPRTELSTVKAWSNETLPSSGSPPSFGIPGLAQWVEAGDLDGDGVDEVVVTTGSSILVVDVEGQCVQELAAVSAHAIAVGDADGDGRAEVAYADDEGVFVITSPSFAEHRGKGRLDNTGTRWSRGCFIPKRILCDRFWFTEHSTSGHS